MYAMQSPKVMYIADYITGDMLLSGHTLYAMYPEIVDHNPNTISTIDGIDNIDYSVYLKPKTQITNTYVRMLMIEFPYIKKVVMPKILKRRGVL